MGTRPTATAGERCLQDAAALLKKRRNVAADELLDAAAPWLKTTPSWGLLRGVAHTRLGRIDAACDVLLPLTHGSDAVATEASAALADVYHVSHRTDALRALLARDQPWARSPRGSLFKARLLTGSDPEQALALLLALVDAATGVEADLRRIAGFDAVRLLDRMARYRPAFELATRLHAAAPAFDLRGFIGSLQLQHRLLVKAAQGATWCTPRAAAVDDVALIVGMPRSGTTLVEQMLDGHPAIAGIGEHDGMGEVASGLVAAGVWPYRMNHLPADTAAALQQDYRRTARRRARDGAQWTLDKSLLTWRWLPAVAAVLPGAVCLHVVRDARDMAISTLLSYLDPGPFGWTRSLASIQQVISAERALVPLALRTFGLAHETIVYEQLVAQPAPHMQRCLARLGLALDERVLAPERNQRTAMTLSHDQVRRPVNDASIGRWQHYDFAFDGSWDALVAQPA